MHLNITTHSRSSSYALISLVAALIAVSLLIPFARVHAIAAVPVSSLNYQFSVNGTLNEVGSAWESSSPYWWLSSGGYLILDNGRGMTMQGIAPAGDRMRSLYASANSLDTDNGTHPQNLFRLVSRSQWDNVNFEASYKINKDNFSASPNRNQSNGLLLMSRYKDQYSLYYAGIRVDGKAIIKKKKNGVYTTLAEKQIFPGSYTIAGNVNLLPHGSWLSLRSETITNSDGSVTVRLLLKKPGESGFTKILEANDASSPITGAGFVGTRTDFMDVEFDNFKATTI